MRILVVDDHEDNLMMLNSLLTGHGYEVRQAHNGKEALDILQTEVPDLVISDILMPVMDGFTLCREIRKDERLKHVPFITYTATYTGKKDEDFAREIGSDEFIVKPCEPDELLRKIQEVMDRVQKLGRSAPGSSLDENEVLKLYNERLVRKLEHKMLETEKEVEAKNQALQALSRSEELLNTTQQLARIGGWQLDVMKDELYWTKELYHLHGLDPERQLSTDEQIEISLKCYSDEDRVKIQEAFQQCKKIGQPYSLECEFTSLSGEKMTILTGGNATVENGVVTKVFGSFQDITRQRQAEQEQAKLRNQLMQVQKLDSIGRLAGGVAHDFNNILTVIMGYTEEIMANLRESDPVYADVEQINKAGARASSLVRQLLAFSRKQTSNAESLQLNSTLEDIHKMLLRLLGEDVIINLDLEENLRPICADPGQIEQIIINLGINARDAMPAGGHFWLGTRNIAASDLFLSAYPDIPPGEYVMLKATDTGIGMSSETLEHIFEPFFTTKRELQGTGLGLATIYGIVNQSKGYIRVESELGKGTSFYIIFPAVTSPAELAAKEQAEAARAGNKELIVVVEDDPSILSMIQMMIRKLGYEVATVASSEEAINLFEEGKLRPDLLITDMVMNGSSGLELIHKLKPIHPSLKLILMSGYAERGLTQDGSLDASIPFLQKPFTRAELADIISKTLQS
ncbi:MAG: response regulator [Candidatus Cloacimonadota bacterium]